MGCKFIVTPQAFRTKSYLKTIFFEVHRICQVVPILDIKCLHVGGVGQEEDQEAGGRVAADDEEDESGESKAYWGGYGWVAFDIEGGHWLGEEV